jgi:hypothetical protein
MSFGCLYRFSEAGGSRGMRYLFGQLLIQHLGIAAPLQEYNVE